MKELKVFDNAVSSSTSTFIVSFLTRKQVQTREEVKEKESQPSFKITTHKTQQTD